MEARQVMGQPGDGIGLAGSRRMLDQVIMSRPVSSCMGNKLAHDRELMVAGEDHRFLPHNAQARRCANLAFVHL
jgi:hypothetical protein